MNRTLVSQNALILRMSMREIKAGVGAVMLMYALTWRAGRESGHAESL
jgi:hypothetical protein